MPVTARGGGQPTGAPRPSKGPSTIQTRAIGSIKIYINGNADVAAEVMTFTSDNMASAEDWRKHGGEIKQEVLNSLRKQGNTLYSSSRCPGLGDIMLGKLIDTVYGFPLVRNLPMHAALSLVHVKGRPPDTVRLDLTTKIRRRGAAKAEKATAEAKRMVRLLM